MKEEFYIRDLEIRQDDAGKLNQVAFVFGPHHYLKVTTNEEGKTSFILCVTHHGFEADASTVDSELEKVIWSIRENPEIKVKRKNSLSSK